MHQALRGIDLLDDARAGDRFFGRALRWGGFTGIAFLFELALIIVGTSVLGGTFLIQQLLVLIPFGVIASLVAFVVGALVGVALGAFDFAGVRLFRWIVVRFACVC